MARIAFPAKLVGESKVCQFDFTADLAVGETVTSETVTAAVYSGTDATPSLIVSGGATVSGAIVSQVITAGVLGVIYLLTCTITTSASNTLQRGGYLAVVSAGV